MSNKPTQAGYSKYPALMLKNLKQRMRNALDKRGITSQAREMLRRDERGLPTADPGHQAAIEAAMGWLARAQDRSMSADGGVARAYSLLSGWTSSYPETTGYIIPTFLEHAVATGERSWRDRGHRMLGWLKAIQMRDGAFQGGRIDSKPKVPVVFNTGQIVVGLAHGEREFGDCESALRRAADWLVKVQDADGCWRKYPSPFAGAGEKTYDTHTAWGLLEADRVLPGRGYGDAAHANVRWALTHQHANGWMAKCCLSNVSAPLTHTLGYALRGVIEAYRHRHDPPLLAAARRTADGLMSALRPDGFLPGKLKPDWSGDATWAGLAGTVQVAICWLMLYQDTGKVQYRDAALRANRYVRRTVLFDHPLVDVLGGVKGSFPINGAYCRFEYPNWAAKFFVDALALELHVAACDARRPAVASGRTPRLTESAAALPSPVNQALEPGPAERATCPATQRSMILSSRAIDDSQR